MNSWHEYKKTACKTSCFTNLVFNFLSQKNRGLTISKLWDVSKFQVSTTSQESSYLAPSSYLPRSVGFPHEHLHLARATPNASTYSVHTISGPHAKQWSLSNLQVASHELLSGRPGTRDGPFFGKHKKKPSMATLKSLLSNKKTPCPKKPGHKIWDFFLFQPPALATKHISLAQSPSYCQANHIHWHQLLV